MNFTDLADYYISEISDASDLSDDDEKIVRVPRRYVRDGHNPFDSYSEEEFKIKYRFTKHTVMHGILPCIEKNLSKINNRGLPIAPCMQLLIVLRFYATTHVQVLMKDTMQISQPSASRVITKISHLLASLAEDYIKMPSSDSARIENRSLFKSLGCGTGTIGIPGVDGIIDCTHVKLIQTAFRSLEQAFKNSEGYFSLNVQTVVGPHMEIMDIEAEWPGSTPNNDIFESSQIYQQYFEGEESGLLIGSAEYECTPFLMTPVPDPKTPDEEMYNQIHNTTRQIVGTTHNVWKRRFPCLANGLTNKLSVCTSIVVACAVLHNMALKFNDPMPGPEKPEEEEYILFEHLNGQLLDGCTIREHLIATMFR